MDLENMEKIVIEMQEKLKAYEDVEQIKQLHYRYMNALTFINWEDVIDCFTEDSSIDVQFGGFIKGKDKIATFFRNMLSQIHIGTEGIFAVHPVIHVEGDRAKGNWLMYIMYADHRTWQARYWIQGIYNAEYVRVDGTWKFFHLEWRPRLEPPGAPPPEMAP